MDHISDSEAESQQSSNDLNRPTTPKSDGNEAAQPGSVLSHRFRDSPQKQLGKDQAQRGSNVEVMIPGPQKPWEYKKDQGDSTVDSVLAIVKGPRSGTRYQIEYESGKREDVSRFLSEYS